MMKILHILLIIALLFTTIPQSFGQESYNMDDQLRSHAERLANEVCFYELETADPPTEEERSDFNICVGRKLNNLQGSQDDMRNAVIALALRAASFRTAPASSEIPNPFYALTLDDAKLIYHDMANCYFNIATRVTIDFYLAKAKGEQDSDHPTDTKVTKDEVYQIDVPERSTCMDLYDDSPWLNQTYEKRMTSFEDTLRSSVKKASNKDADQGFTTYLGEFILEDLEFYLTYLQFISTTPLNGHFPQDGLPKFAYSRPRTRDDFTAQFKSFTTTLQHETDFSEEALKASLRAFNNFERTFPIHVAYQKMKYYSDQIRQKIRTARLSWRLLNNKFTNASIEGGK